MNDFIFQKFLALLTCFILFGQAMEAFEKSNVLAFIGFAAPYCFLSLVLSYELTREINIDY